MPPSITTCCVGLNPYQNKPLKFFSVATEEVCLSPLIWVLKVKGVFVQFASPMLETNLKPNCRTRYELFHLPSSSFCCCYCYCCPLKGNKKKEKRVADNVILFALVFYSDSFSETCDTYEVEVFF